MISQDAVTILSYLGAATVGAGAGVAVVVIAMRSKLATADNALSALLQVTNKHSGRAEDQVDSASEEAELAFAVHAAAVSNQVTAYADALADGDELLRARLRQIERHMRRVD